MTSIPALRTPRLTLRAIRADPLLVYAIASRAWGRGYATEGVRAALDWIMATHHP